MSRPGWYMVCYDIADPRRLGKVHRLMKKKGMAAQKSVFFVQRGEREIKNFLDELGRIIKRNEDDVRAYPVESPKKVWTTGGILEAFPLVMPGGREKDTGEKKKKSIWQRLFGKGGR